MRDSAGISPDFARPWCPDMIRSEANRSGTRPTTLSSSPPTASEEALTIVPPVKRIALIVLALGATAALAAFRLKKRQPKAPPAEAGTWVLAGDGNPS